jgi:hypothetical protein
LLVRFTDEEIEQNQLSGKNHDAWLDSKAALKMIMNNENDKLIDPLSSASLHLGLLANDLRLYGGCHENVKGQLIYWQSKGAETRFLGVYAGRIHDQAEVGRVWKARVITEILLNPSQVSAS